MSERSLRRALGAQGIAAIERAVAAAERTTSAEIAVFIREWSSYRSLFHLGDADDEVRRRAETLFVTHGIDRTSARNGVMLYVSLHERAAVVLGDVAIDRRVPPETWREIVRRLVNAAKRGQLIDGVCAAVSACAAVLATQFPRGADDVNELADEPNLS